jgi:hypothetical protein
MDALGMIEDARRSHPPAFVYLLSDGCDVRLATPQDASGAQPSRTIELGFEVEDIAAMRAHLAAHGIPDYREESLGWGETLKLRDSDGHRVLIYSFKKTSDPGPREDLDARMPRDADHCQRLMGRRSPRVIGISFPIRHEQRGGSGSLRCPGTRAGNEEGPRHRLPGPNGPIGR